MQRHVNAGRRHTTEARDRALGMVVCPPDGSSSIGESRARLVALVSALLMALTSLVVLLVFSTIGRLHQVPVSVVAPPMIVTALNDDLHGEILIQQTVDPRSARRELDQGRSMAVLIVDLSRAEDTLVLPVGMDERVVAALVGTLRSAEVMQGRTLVVHAREVPAGAPLARWLTSGALVLGFVIVALISVGVGARARRVHRYARLILVVLLAVAGLGVAVTVGWAPALWLGGALVMAALLTWALEVLFGWKGFVIAAALCLTVVWPTALGVDPVFLPVWMQWGWHWSPTGSATAAVTSAIAFGTAGMVHHALQMGAWMLGGVLALWMARHVPRQLDGVASVRRRSIGATVVAFLAVALAAVALAPDAVIARPSIPPRPNRLSECTPIPDVDSVADLNRIARIPGTSDFAGADVGVDVSLSDGRTLWLFADTLRENAGMVRNSMLISDGRCLHAVVPEGGGAVIPNRPHTGVGYWPMSAVRISMPGYDLVPVWAQRVHQSGSGVFGFETLGPSVAVFVVRPGDVPQLVAIKDLAPDLPDLGRPMWGSAAAIDGDWIYLYGTANHGDTLGFSVAVARVHIDHLLDPAAMQYWDGYEWSESAGSAAEVIPGAGGTSQTFSVLHRDQGWYAVSKQDEFLGSYLRVWISGSPSGPFYEGPVLAILPSELEAGHLVYMVLAHPEVLPEDDSMVVSYSRNDVQIQHIIDHPRQYRPRFLRVWFP